MTMCLNYKLIDELKKLLKSHMQKVHLLYYYMYHFVSLKSDII